ncbi:MAG: hypothetical protein V4581_16430 [Bacteroidota bacterium]
MGFLGTIPADKLAALYDTTKRQLILYAEGVVQGATYGFNFRQDTWFGGLKFTLQAWTGPLTGKDQHYTHQQAFNISLPSRVYPSGSVTIVTANHPEGIIVPIRFTGLPPHSNGLKAATAAEAKTAKTDAVASATPGHTNLNVLYKTQFEIKAQAAVPTGGSVHISYDTKHVQLVGSKVHDREIVWTFFAAEMGDTQVVVTTSGGIATYIMEQVYDVKIFVL